MEPTCPRCQRPLDPLTARPSHDGPVHPGCAQPADLVAPVPRPNDYNIAPPMPAYGLAPRRARLLPWALLVASTAGGAGALWWLAHRT